MMNFTGETNVVKLRGFKTNSCNKYMPNTFNDTYSTNTFLFSLRLFKRINKLVTIQKTPIVL